MKKIVLILIFVIILFGACALEVANVVGPAGGYVFLDKGKGSYDTLGWRYLECSPINAGSIVRIENYKNTNGSYNPAEAKVYINEVLDEFNKSGEYNDWEIPNEEELILMLQSFRWELTKFSSKYQYISSEGYVYRGNLDNSKLSEQERLENPTGMVYIRPVRRF